MIKTTFLIFVSLSFILVWFSGIKMLWFLVDKGIEKTKLYSFNPLIFMKYLEVTKKYEGKSGIWFKVQWISFVFAIFSLICLIVVVEMEG